MNTERLKQSETSFVDSAQCAGDDSGNSFLGNVIDEKPLWAGLYESLRDAFFPLRLPPLELISMPIPAPDRMAVKTNPWAIGAATIANGGILALILWMGLSATMNPPPKSPLGQNLHLKDFSLFAPSTARTGGSEGSGSNERTDPIEGRLPRREEMPITPPQVRFIENPRLPVDSAIAVPLEIKLPENPSLPNIGVYRSTNVTLASDGPGTKAGIGSGSHGSYGPGNGDGPGFNSGNGDSVYTPGVGGVSAPVPILTPEAEFSDEARRNKYQGVCMIEAIVDSRGYPRSLRVVNSLGMGLDEKALEAVQKYRFKPAMKDGKPVSSIINVAVNFRLF
jgi:periplasmic protein TonB